MLYSLFVVMICSLVADILSLLYWAAQGVPILPIGNQLPADLVSKLGLWWLCISSATVFVSKVVHN